MYSILIWGLRETIIFFASGGQKLGQTHSFRMTANQHINEAGIKPDRLENINNQLAETEQALRRTLEFFDRIEGTALATRLGVSELRLRLLSDLERLAQERKAAGPDR